MATTKPDRLLRLAEPSLRMPGGTTDDPLARFDRFGARLSERRTIRGAGSNDDRLTSFTYDGQRRLITQDVTPGGGGAGVFRIDLTVKPEGHPTKRRYDRLGVGSGGGDVLALDEWYRLDVAKLGVPSSQFGLTDFTQITQYQRHLDYTYDRAQNRTQLVGKG